MYLAIMVKITPDQGIIETFSNLNRSMGPNFTHYNHTHLTIAFLYNPIDMNIPVKFVCLFVF